MHKLRLREVKDYNQGRRAGKCKVKCRPRQTTPEPIFFLLCHIISWPLYVWLLKPESRQVYQKVEDQLQFSIKEGYELKLSNNGEGCFPEQCCSSLGESSGAGAHVPGTLEGWPLFARSIGPRLKLHVALLSWSLCLEKKTLTPEHSVKMSYI